MRELKFRLWNKHAKHYITTCIVDGVEYNEISAFDLFQLRSDAQFQSDVIIEQYTGFKDKNGKEIYEGDIVKVRSRRKLLKGLYQVLWNEEAGGFECECLEPYMVLDDNMKFKDIRVFNEMHIEFEVIGNIHENKELLK